MGNLIDPSLIFEQIPDLLTYLPVTMELAIFSMTLALVIGFILAIIKYKRIPVLFHLVNFYISIIRGTPVLVQLYIAYFGIPTLIKSFYLSRGWEYTSSGSNGFYYAVVALGINQSAFLAELFRGALLATRSEEVEAASALGMTYLQVLRRIILPHTFVIALPGLGNAFIALIKGTSLAFTCAVVEMTARGQILGGRTYRYFEVYLSLAIIYWVVTIVIEQLIKLLEKRFEIPEQVKQSPIESDTNSIGSSEDISPKAKLQHFALISRIKRKQQV